MTEQRFKEIDRLVAMYDDVPDGAFFGIMDEHGVSSDELAAYAFEHERRHKHLTRDKKEA